MTRIEGDGHRKTSRARGENQSLFREVNERIESAATKLGPTFTEFMCECADESCFEYVSMTLEEYAAVRERSTHFVVKPGHVYPDVEVVSGGAGDRFEVVEKLDVAAEVAEELDPRS